MAKDVFHQQVKKALIKDGWIITHDPFTIRIRDFQEINYPNKRTTETQRTQREEE